MTALVYKLPLKMMIFATHLARAYQPRVWDPKMVCVHSVISYTRFMPWNQPDAHKPGLAPTVPFLKVSYMYHLRDLAWVASIAQADKLLLRLTVLRLRPTPSFLRLWRILVTASGC